MVNPAHPRTRLSRPSRQRMVAGGFTYVVLLLALAFATAGMAATVEFMSSTLRSQRLRQLDWAGDQIRFAIGRYYDASPGSVKQYPAKLEDLLIDQRYLSLRRHLRQIYANPLTGVVDWQPVFAPQGGLVGVSVTLPDGGTRIWRHVPTPPSR